MGLCVGSVCGTSGHYNPRNYEHLELWTVTKDTRQVSDRLEFKLKIYPFIQFMWI